MSLRLTKEQLDQLSSAVGLMSELVSGAKAGEEIMGCPACTGTCTDNCTGCQTCKDTSKA